MVGSSGYKYITMIMDNCGNVYYIFIFKRNHIKQGSDLEELVKYRNEWLINKFKLVDDYTGGV